MYLLIPPERDIDKVLALPVFDLLCSCDFEWEVVVLEDNLWRQLFCETVWVRFVKAVDIQPNILTVDLRLKDIGGLCKKRDYRIFLRRFLGIFPDNAIEFFLSGDFSRRSIWFNEDEIEYSFLVKELSSGRFVVVAIGVDGGIEKIKKMVRFLLDESELVLVILSNDDGKMADEVAALNKQRCLSLSFRKFFRYGLAVMSGAIGVIGTDEVAVVLGGYVSKCALLMAENTSVFVDGGFWSDFFKVCDIKLPVSYVGSRFLNLVERVYNQSTTKERLL